MANRRKKENSVAEGGKLIYVNLSNMDEIKMHIGWPVEKPVESVKNSARFRPFTRVSPACDREVIHLIHKFLYRKRKMIAELCFLNNW